MSSPLTPKQQELTPPKLLGNFIHWLTGPSPSIQASKHRYQARLLASLLIAFIPLAFLSILVQLLMVPDFERIFPTLLASLFVLTLAYMLSRTQHYKIGALITTATPLIAVFVTMVIDPTNTDTYFFVIISVMLSSVLLSWRWTAALAVATLLMAISLLLFNPALMFADIVTSLVFLTITSGLILVFMRYGESLEASRQDKLAVSENRWRMMINQSPFSTVIYSVDGRLQGFNKAAINLWNLSPQELESVRMKYNILEDEQLKANGVLPYIRRGFDGTATVAPPAKYQFSRQDDCGLMVVDNRWIVTHCYPIKDEADDVREVVLIHEDITELKQVETALRESEARLEEAQRIAHVGSWEWIAETDTPSWSKELYAILEVDPTKPAPKLVEQHKLFTPESTARINSAVEKAMQTGTPYEIELERVREDGTRKWLLIRGEQWFDEQGHLKGLRGTALDITEHKQAEVLEARLGKMFDDSLNEIYTFDAETLRFISVNQGARENLGYSMAELEQMTPLDLKPEFTPASFAQLLEPLRTGEQEKIQFTTTHRRQDGSLYPVEVHLQLSELGSVQVFVAIILDITERKQTEELIRRQDRLAAIGQLAAGIAHDFNNIMAVISLYSEMLLKSQNLTEKGLRQLQTIRQQAKYAADLTGQILDFSRQSVMERQPVDLLSFLREFMKLMARTLPEHIKLDLTYGEDVCLVNADLTRIQQAFMNLAFNSRDAMPDGGELRIGLERVTIGPDAQLSFPNMEIGEWVKIALSDNGTGISSNELPRLFEPFFTTKGPGQGTGLGLAQVYGIVMQHDGHIDVESQVGQGTTFTIYLPALSIIQPEVHSLELEGLAKGRGETILVVEDNVMTQAALVDGLESLDYQVLMAATGREALTILEDRRDEIALVLSDLVMPTMGGIQLLQALRQRKIDVPVVILTGHPLGENLEELRDGGLNEWLTKPVTLEKLAQVITRLLDVN